MVCGAASMSSSVSKSGTTRSGRLTPNSFWSIMMTSTSLGALAMLMM